MKKLMITTVLMFLLLLLIPVAQAELSYKRVGSVESKGVLIKIGDRDTDVFTKQKGFQVWLLNKDRLSEKVFVILPEESDSFFYAVTFQEGIATKIEKVTKEQLR